MSEPTDSDQPASGEATTSGAVVPRVYRSMKEDGGRPMLGSSAATLGVRQKVDGKGDIPVADGFAYPYCGGMSVSPSVASIPPMYLPKRLAHLNRAARGSNDRVVWRIGSGPFASGRIAPDLTLRPDSLDHGLVEPARAMTFAQYQEAIRATRTTWDNGEDD